MCPGPPGHRPARWAGGAIPAAPQPLAEALTAAAMPRSVIAWLRASPADRLLARLADDSSPVTHQRLDELPPGHAQHWADA
jgi:hypothetical protein